MHIRTQTVMLTALGLVLAGCAEIHTSAPDAVTGTVYSTDVVNKASVCTAAPLSAVKDGSTVPVTISTGGGGWCGVTLSQGGRPYSAGLLTKRARAGKVLVHTVGNTTRVDYTPAERAVVPDSFSIRLIPGDAILQVTVTPATAVSK
jgi:hypothetical protein